MLTNQELDIALENCPAERRTTEYMKARIKDVHFSTLPHSTVTICSLTIDNGFSVRGESACVDPANFDRAIGEKIAYDNAFRQLWPLFGFRLAELRLEREQAKKLAEA